MARGYPSTHPATEAALRQLGIVSSAVTQGWGRAKASAGYHDPEGMIHGRRFSSCVDLAYSVVKRDGLKGRLLQAGIVPFVRDEDSGWAGSPHVHCIHVGLRDTWQRAMIRPGPRSQILDYTRGLDGLRGHGPLRGPWLPTEKQRLRIASAYAIWVADLATSVFVRGVQVRCYAWLEGKKVRCDAGMLCAALGGVRTPAVDPPAWWIRSDAFAPTTGKWEGDYYRADVREIADAWGLSVQWNMSAGLSSCVVHLW